MNFFLIYFGIGIGVYCALLLLFRKTGVGRKGLNVLWWGWLTSGELIAILWGPLLWPLLTVLALLLWLGEIIHIKLQRRDAREKEAVLKRANKYSHMSMSELLAAQKKVMGDSHPERKADQPNMDNRH